MYKYQRWDCGFEPIIFLYKEKKNWYFLGFNVSALYKG